MTHVTFEEFSEALNKVFTANNIEEFANEHTVSKFYDLTLLLQKANAEINLTAINDTTEIIVKHLADSLLAATLFEKNRTVIDIGCGAGFPSLPLAIARPDLKITSLDSTGKKINFVRDAAQKLKLGNLTAVCARAEEFVSEDTREGFDYATARAVSRLNILNELTLPFVKVGGSFIAMKAKDGDNELAEAENGIKILGGEVKEVRRMPLRDGDSFEAQRVIININKTSSTPGKYPRQYSKIAKKPI